MERLFNKAWQKQSAWLWLLLPMAWLYRLVFSINKTLFHWGLKKTYYPSVPVIVIGNITVGGSGKTPFIIALVNYLQQKNIHVAVISRGYGGDSTQMPCIVTPQSLPSQVGDEPCLIVQSSQNFGNPVPMAVCPNRGQAIELLLNAFPQTQLILADDGLQHFALDRDQNWVVVDADRGFGNRQVLPVGFLREPIKRLIAPNTQVIFHQKLSATGQWQLPPNLLPIAIKNSLSKKYPNHAYLFMQLVEHSPVPLFTNKINDKNSLSQNLSTLAPQTVIAMTGIGYPQRFFTSVKKMGFDIVEMPLNDHHVFTLGDFADLPDLPIMVTAKDAVKIHLLLQAESGELAQSLISRIWVLPVVADLSDSVYDAMDRALVECGIVPTDNDLTTKEL